MLNSVVENVLDVGCGSSKINGAIGIDQYLLSGVDIVHNLDAVPWPLNSNSFDRIIFSHSISHLSDLSDIFIECHRLLRDNGVIEIVAPHYASDNFNTDPTHKLHLGVRSMFYYCNNVPFGYKYLPGEISFNLIESGISFREVNTSWRKSVKFNPLKLIGVEWLINKYSRIYERFFCWILPPSEVYFVMKKTR
jgi:predicted SAM-dependent methyltransferase